VQRVRPFFPFDSDIAGDTVKLYGAINQN